MLKSVVWALDFGEESVIAVAAHEKTPGEWTLLGKGETRSRGIKRGEVEKLTDAVECVVEAVRGAEKDSRRRCRKLYINYDDHEMLSAHPCGSKALIGEGQIQRSDVREAVHSAARLVGDFERTAMYAREIDYVIDGKDTVLNPCGVFGHRLDVTLHVLLARAARFELWKKMMKRAQIERFVPVVSLVSAAHAVLDKKSPKRVLWDLGEDYGSGGVVERGLLREYAVFLKAGLSPADVKQKVEAASRPWIERYGITEPLCVTGDLAAKHFKALVGVPKGLPSLSDPKHASLVGLLHVVSELQKNALTARGAGKHWMGRIRQRATTVIQDYF